MKFALTGHTQGLGRALANAIELSGHSYIGFSRSNGFDLQKPSTIARILEQAQDSDVFINNAFHEWAQIDLLYALFESWQDKNRVIVNISSNSGDGTKNYIHKYAVIKYALDKASAQLNNIQDAKCRVLNFRPGWIATERIIEKKISDPMLETNHVAQFILDKTFHHKAGLPWEFTIIADNT